VPPARPSRVENDVKVGVAKARNIVRPGIERGNNVDVNPHCDQQTRDFAHIIPVPKAQCGRTEHIAARLVGPTLGAGRSDCSITPSNLSTGLARVRTSW
jgi:hypothetical protein